jgi:DNA recombination-mediator protein A
MFLVDVPGGARPIADGVQDLRAHLTVRVRTGALGRDGRSRHHESGRLICAMTIGYTNALVDKGSWGGGSRKSRGRTDRDADGSGARQRAPTMDDHATLFSDDFAARAVSPLVELGAYEALWDDESASFRTLSERFAAEPDAVPSEFVARGKALEYAEEVRRRFRQADVRRFGVRVHGAGEYPMKLRDAAHPVELLYFQGWWDLAESRSVAVVGTRKPSREGLARTRKLVRALVEDDFTVVSGLAMGIDTAAI